MSSSNINHRGIMQAFNTRYTKTPFGFSEKKKDRVVSMRNDRFLRDFGPLSVFVLY